MTFFFPANDHCCCGCVCLGENPHRQAPPRSRVPSRAGGTLGAVAAAPGWGVAWNQRFYTLVSCIFIFFLVAKPKSDQNKSPRQHLNHSQGSARRANNRVRGAGRWLNEEFAASGFTQGHEDQQIANGAEPPQAAQGGNLPEAAPARRPAASRPWPAGRPKPPQPPSGSSTEREVTL